MTGVISENLAEALRLSEGLEEHPNSIERVSRQVGIEASAWAFQQWSLRKRARAKFALADKMLFTREALEQATHERVAAYRASKFPKKAVVADLTAGIGADLIALGRRGEAIGFEIDPTRYEYACHNLEVNGVEADVRLIDCLAAPWDFQFAVADPARRVDGVRTLNSEAFQPSPDALADKMRSLRLGVMKMTPMAADHVLERWSKDQEFISFGGECREVSLYFGEPAQRGRWAVHLERGSRLPAQPLTRLSLNTCAFFYEADPAAIRANALGTLCRDYDLSPLGDSNGYLAGNRLWRRTPWLTPFECLGIFNNLPSAKARLIELGSAKPVIKTRGSIRPEAIAKELQLTGKKPLELAVYANGKRHAYAVLRRF